MRFLPLALLLTALPAAAAPVGGAAGGDAAPPVPPAVRPLDGSCKRPHVHQADGPKRAEQRKLGELPPGDLILSVYHEVDGCMEPAIVRYGKGRPAPEAGQPEPVRPGARVWR